jgi:hypothetical protein
MPAVVSPKREPFAAETGAAPMLHSEDEAEVTYT